MSRGRVNKERVRGTREGREGKGESRGTEERCTGRERIKKRRIIGGRKRYKKSYVQGKEEELLKLRK